MRKKRKAVRKNVYYIKKIKVICICKKGNCEGFCNGIANVDIRKKKKVRR